MCPSHKNFLTASPNGLIHQTCLPALYPLTMNLFTVMIFEIFKNTQMPYYQILEIFWYYLRNVLW